MVQEQIRRNEASELQKWQRKAGIREYAGYSIVIIALLSLVRALDEFVTSAPNSVQTSVVNEFFVKGMGMDFAAGLSQLSLIGSALLVLSIIATLYLTLADKYGRKPILIISVFGMAVGVGLCWLSSNLFMHILGRALLTFFVATDVHSIYTMEIAPDDKRSTVSSVVGCIGYLAIMLVSVSRNAYTVDGELAWRGIFLIPTLVGLALGVLLIVFGRESRAFLNERIGYLSVPYEQRQAEAEAAKQKKVQAGGLGKAFKYMFQHRQPRNIFFASVFQLFAVMAFYGYYEAIMTTNGMSTEAVTQALLMYPLSCALFTLICGFLSDKFGRKPIGVLYSVLAFLGLIGFIVGAKNGIDPSAVGLLYGLQLGCFWSYGGLLGLSFTETVPTEIRSTAVAAKGLIAVVISIVAAVAIGILVQFVELGTLCLVWGAVTLGISAVLFLLTVRETKDADLNNVISD